MNPMKNYNCAKHRMHAPMVGNVSSAIQFFISNSCINYLFLSNGIRASFNHSFIFLLNLPQKLKISNPLLSLEMSANHRNKNEIVH